MAALDANFLTSVDRDGLDAEIRETREQVAHLTGAMKRGWNDQQLAKMGVQLDAARRHLARLIGVRGGA
jgi:hypothetical protein